MKVKLNKLLLIMDYIDYIDNNELKINLVRMLKGKKIIKEYKLTNEQIHNLQKRHFNFE
jgi:hypothetical protein